MKKLIVAIFVSAVAMDWAASDALAHLKFRTAFLKKYVAEHPDAEFQKVAKKEMCWVCHLKGLKKPYQNQYGRELNKLIEGSADLRQKKARADGGTAAYNAEWKKLLDELDKAFAAVEEIKSPTGETFGERLKAGHLPVDPEAAQALAAELKAKDKDAGGEDEPEEEDE